MAAPTVTLLTPHAEDPRYLETWRPLWDSYRAAFGAAGVDLQSLPWPRAAESRSDVTLASLAWGYHADEAAFEAMLDAWPSHRRLVNAPALLRWNMRKTYLAGMETAGVSTIPTTFLVSATEADVIAAFEAFGADALVVKRQVSAGGHNMLRARRGKALGDVPTGAVMIQPFLPSVAGEGELSLFVFGGRIAHAVRKVASGGEFRVQPQYGGHFTLFEPDEEARALAQAAVAACPVPPVYARADMVRGLDGRLQLMELECIEPDPYFALAPDGGAAFVAAVLAAA